MLKGLLLVLTSLSASAFACPKLQGSWTCHDSVNPAQSAVLTVTQRPEAAATIYEFMATGAPQIFITDGKDHVANDAAHGATMTSTSTCTADTGVLGKMKIKAANPPVEMSGDFDYELVNPTTMTAKANVTYNINGQAGTQVQTLNCTLN